MYGHIEHDMEALSQRKNIIYMGNAHKLVVSVFDMGIGSSDYVMGNFLSPNPKSCIQKTLRICSSILHSQSKDIFSK